MSDTDIVDNERLALLLGWHKARPWHAWADVVSNGEVVMMVRELQRFRSGRAAASLEEIPGPSIRVTIKNGKEVAEITNWEDGMRWWKREQERQAMSDTDIVEQLKIIGAITANWASTDEAAIRKTCRAAAAEIERLRSGFAAFERTYGGLTVAEIDTKIVGLYASSSVHAFNKTKAEIPANELREIADLWAALLARVKQIDGPSMAGPAG